MTPVTPVARRLRLVRMHRMHSPILSKAFFSCRRSPSPALSLAYLRISAIQFTFSSSDLFRSARSSAGVVFDLAPPLEMFDCGLKAFSMLKLKISVNHEPSTRSGAERGRKNPIAGNEIMFTLNLKPPLIILIAFWEKIRFFPNERRKIASHFSLSGRPSSLALSALCK